MHKSKSRNCSQLKFELFLVCNEFHIFFLYAYKEYKLVNQTIFPFSRLSFLLSFQLTLEGTILTVWSEYIVKENMIKVCCGVLYVNCDKFCRVRTTTNHSSAKHAIVCHASDPARPPIYVRTKHDTDFSAKHRSSNIPVYKCHVKFRTS